MGLARRLQISRLVSIVAETKQKIFGRISSQNQERNFLAVFLAEQNVTQEIFSCIFKVLNN